MRGTENTLLQTGEYSEAREAEARDGMYLLLLKIKWVLQQADIQPESKKNFLRALLRLFLAGRHWGN